jgi:hypothetical protein
MFTTRDARRKRAAATDEAKKIHGVGPNGVKNAGRVIATPSIKNAQPDITTSERFNTYVGVQGITDNEGLMSCTSTGTQNKKKRRRIKPPPIYKQNKPPLESLPNEVLQNILVFFDSIRDLFNLVNTSKSFRKAIEPRPDVVIKAAIYGGGNT